MKRLRISMKIALYSRAAYKEAVRVEGNGVAEIKERRPKGNSDARRIGLFDQAYQRLINFANTYIM